MVKIVTIGNGTGQAGVLKGLKQYYSDIAAVIGVTDNGGHSGKLREILNIPAPGDVRNCLENLLDSRDSVLSQVLGYRFAQGELDGVSLGNLILAALIDLEKSKEKAVARLVADLGIKLNIIPVSNESTNICAVCEDGYSIMGEFQIIERENYESPIVKMYHEKEIEATSASIEAVRNADILVVGPGALRTGLISLLLAKGLKDAVMQSHAKIIYICNIMTGQGQTERFSTEDHVIELTKYLGKEPDYAIVNIGSIPNDVQALYNGLRSYLVVHSTFSEVKTSVVMDNLIAPIDDAKFLKYEQALSSGLKITPHLVMHDSPKLAKIVKFIIDKILIPEASGYCVVP